MHASASGGKKETRGTQGEREIIYILHTLHRGRYSVIGASGYRVPLSRSESSEVMNRGCGSRLLLLLWPSGGTWLPAAAASSVRASGRVSNLGIDASSRVWEAGTRTRNIEPGMLVTCLQPIVMLAACTCMASQGCEEWNVRTQSRRL